MGASLEYMKSKELLAKLKYFISYLFEAFILHCPKPPIVLIVYPIGWTTDKMFLYAKIKYERVYSKFFIHFLNTNGFCK